MAWIGRGFPSGNTIYDHWLHHTTHYIRSPSHFIYMYTKYKSIFLPMPSALLYDGVCTQKPPPNPHQKQRMYLYEQHISVNMRIIWRGYSFSGAYFAMALRFALAISYIHIFDETCTEYNLLVCNNVCACTMMTILPDIIAHSAPLYT